MIRAYRYQLPLLRPLTLRGTEIKQRSGLLLAREDLPGVWSEAAPLPAFSHESLETVTRLACHSQFDTLPPSLQFARRMLQRPWDNPDESPRYLSLNALLDDAPQAMIEQATRLRDSGYRSVKVKVARRTVDEEIQLVTRLSGILRSDQSLRLDANRGWSLEQAVKFGSAVANLPIEYIEEPLHSPDDCEAFWGATGLPYALDETLVDAVDLDRFPHVAALVIKPTLLGDPNQYDRFTSANVPLVFSACFESGVGIQNIARLAWHFSPTLAAGLDTYRWLATDTLRNSLDIEDGRLAIRDRLDVDERRLTRVT